jgi:hypothetical protein
MNILCQQTVAISISQCVVEHLACLLAPAEIPQDVDQTEPAYEKGRFRQAEVILARITHNVHVAQKFTLYCFYGANEAGIVGRQGPISGSNSTLASRSSIPIAAVNSPHFSFQA